MDADLPNGHFHEHGRPGYLKLLAASVGALMLFSAAVSGGIYHWPRDVVCLTSIVLLVYCLPGPVLPRAGRLWPVLALLAVTALSTLWSVNINNTASETFTLSGYAALAYISALAGADDDDRRTLLSTLFIAAVAVSLYGIYQYFFGFTRTEEYLRQAGSVSGLSGGEIGRALYKLGGRRAFSTMLSPDVLACYLAVAFPVGLSLLVSARRKVLYVPGLAAMLVAALLTKSVGGLIALAAGTIIFVAARGPAWDWTMSRIVALGLVVAVAAGSLYWVAVHRGNAEVGVKNSMSQRYNYWSGAMAIFRDAEVTGRGAGSFEILYPGHMKPGADETRYAHNLPLQAMAETGIIGLLTVCLVFLVFFINCLRGLRVPDGGDIMAGVMAGGAAFFVHNLVDYSYYVPETAVTFWLLFGISAADANGASGRAPGRLLTGILTSILLAALAVTIGFFYIKSCLAGFYEARAVGALETAGIADKAAVRTTPAPNAAIRLAGDAVRTKPYDDRYRAFLAGLYEGRATVDGPVSFAKAEALYLDAIRLNPYYPFYYRELGLLYLRRGDKAKAAENFRKAVSRYPANKKLQEYLELAGN